MTDGDFAFLRLFLQTRSGLALGPEKRYFVESRLRRVCAESGLASLAELVARLKQQDEALGQAVLDATAVHETSFFRDAAVFAALRSSVLPRLIERRAESRRLRIWSAAASTGQEAYSLAMLLSDMAPRLAGWRVSILATDLSRHAVDRARAGSYSQFEVQRGLPIRALLRHFCQTGEGWSVSDELRRLVTSRVLNLLGELSPLGEFDLILCRNVLIYFDPAAKSSLLTKLAHALAPDGVLCLGASETLCGLAPGLAHDPVASGFLGNAPWPGPARRAAG